jgi:hypothetical protein
VLWSERERERERKKEREREISYFEKHEKIEKKRERILQFLSEASELFLNDSDLVKRRTSVNTFFTTSPSLFLLPMNPFHTHRRKHTQTQYIRTQTNAHVSLIRITVMWATSWLPWKILKVQGEKSGLWILKRLVPVQKREALGDTSGSRLGLEWD